jgi:single-strand DNA-binding protein
MNKVILIGRIGKDAEYNNVNAEMNVITFTLATSESYLNKQGQKVEAAEWHTIKRFQKSTKIAEYLTKGTLVAVEGQIKTETWDKEGKTNYKTIIKAEKIDLLSKSNSTPSSEQVENSIPKEDDDDLPF